MIDRLQEILDKSYRIVIGLMSGTSLDGIDAALVQISGFGLQTKIKLLDFQSIGYTAAARNQILNCIEAGSAAIISETNFMLARKFADAAWQIMEKNGFKSGEVDLIGSHGQTIWHDHRKHTLQIGEPSLIAEKTGAVVVADFRARDVAVGGSGAPLVPYVDFLLFRSETKSRILQNIGGIANCTILTKGIDSVKNLLAFDNGPGMMIVDALVRRLTNFQQEYDRDGKIAKSAKVNNTLLKKWLTHSYFEKLPAKSCGREQFGEIFVDEILKLQPLNGDLIATAVAFTAASIVDSYNRFVFPITKIEEIIVSGGGSQNPILMKHLQNKLPDILIQTSDEFNIPADAKEAIAFAILANETLAGNPANVPAVTGAKKEVVLGKIVM